MATGNGANGGAIFVQTNEAGRNQVLVFRRDGDGQLAPPATADTGGAGDGWAHLASQGSVLVTADGRHLLVANAGSDELSLFALDAEPTLLQVVPSRGRAPKSVAEHGGLVYVLNAGSPSLAGFRLEDDRLVPIEASLRELPGDADPAQVGFSPDGSTLVVTQRGADEIALFGVGDEGLLREPSMVPSAGRTPYGFAFGAGGTLVVTEAFGAAKGKAAVSSYRIREGRAEPISRSIGNGRSEICWAVASGDGRYAYATNFADGAVSRYSIADDGSITLDDAVAGRAVEGRTGLRDAYLTADGRFLYAIDADARRIFGWAVAESGLEPLGSWEGVPATVAGLAAR
jgi:6-phosphogluconolactonase